MPCLNKNNPELKLYDLGVQKLEEDLSIERIIKQLRDIKILTKMKLLTPKDRFMI